MELDLKNFTQDDEKIPDNQMVMCLTCAIVQGRNAATDEEAIELVWNECAWNLSREDEEYSAYLHAKELPHHILIKGLDWGYKINGV